MLIPTVAKLTGHIDLFHTGDDGERRLVRTSRPCEVCGLPLEHVVKPLFLEDRDALAHRHCRRAIGGRPKGDGPVWRSYRDLLRDGLLPTLAGGAPAENFTNEGLTYMENIFPRATQSVPTTLYFLLFTAQSATTVPDRTTVLASQPGTGTANVGEPAAGTGGYARATVPNTAWGAPAVAGTGVETVSSQISFAQSTAAYSPSGVNGFGLTQQLAQGAGSIGIAYANFNDTTVTTVNSQGYVVQVTATFHLDI